MGTGSCEKIGLATARSHSRLSKFFRNEELFPSHERKRVVFRIFHSFQSPCGSAYSLLTLSKMAREIARFL